MLQFTNATIQGMLRNQWASISVLAKFVLHMHRKWYFLASGQNSNTTVGLGDFDFLYGTDIMVNRGHKHVIVTIDSLILSMCHMLRSALW